jgi:hypothetical protein
MPVEPKQKGKKDVNNAYKQAIIDRMKAKANYVPPAAKPTDKAPKSANGSGTSISVVLVEERIKSIATKRMQDELYLAKAREELIEKRLVEKQAAYLLVSLRQRILALPNTYARRFLGLADAKQSAALLRELALGLLNEIRSLPEKVVDPNWLRTLEEEEAKDADTR